jgi:hypothetical protein
MKLSATLVAAFLAAVAFVSNALAGNFNVTTTADTGPGSLRQAITDANANSDADTISFAIPGSGVHTIALASTLPAITAPVTIDGYTQPGASANTLSVGDNAVILIRVDGTNAGVIFNMSGTGSTIRGLCLVNGSVSIPGANNSVTGNFIGIDTDGATPFTVDTPVSIAGANATIGGALPSLRI